MRVEHFIEKMDPKNQIKVTVFIKREDYYRKIGYFLFHSFNKNVKIPEYFWTILSFLRTLKDNLFDLVSIVDNNIIKIKYNQNEEKFIYTHELMYSVEKYGKKKDYKRRKTAIKHFNPKTNDNLYLKYREIYIPLITNEILVV